MITVSEDNEHLCSGWETSNKVCINSTQLCDKSYDCPNHEDEHGYLCQHLHGKYDIIRCYFKKKIKTVL